MRISTQKNDPGYQPCLPKRDIKVFLDDVEVKWCVTADEEAGEVLVYRTDANGDPLFSGARRVFDTETRRGVVRIDWPGGPPCSSS